MFRQWKGFLAGVIFTVLTTALAGTVMLAAATGTSITVYYDNIRILLNGKEIETKDVDGHKGEPFSYKGTVYVPIRTVAQSFNKLVDWDKNSKQVKIYDNDIDQFWDSLVKAPENNIGDENEIYWRHIGVDIIEKVDALIEKHGPEVLFNGLESTNVYSQYYCINRLVEYYNHDDIRVRAIDGVTPFLNSTNKTLKNGAQFAISVLEKKFDSPYIVNSIDGIKIFPLFNDYSEYGSYNELWMIKDDRLSKLHSFNGIQTYIDMEEPIKLSPGNDKIAVQTSSRKSSSFNIIDLNTGKVSPEIMKLAIEKLAMDHKNYNNTYPDGGYSWGHTLKWIDNDTVEFEARLAYNYMDIIEEVIVRYNFLNQSIEYTKQ